MIAPVSGVQLDPLEVAWAIPLGEEPAVGALPQSSVKGARLALEQVVRRALLRPPCVVSFSGGRDSSAVLALAVLVARREGLAEPIPVTNRFAAVPSADERDWQELVVRHLRLSDWTCLELTDELDMLGPAAVDILHRHGVLAPFNSHFHVPLLALAPGGSLLTGIGGDEVFEPTDRAPLGRLLYGRALPSRRQLKPLALATLPRSIRRLRLASEPAFKSYGWLRREARIEIARRYADWMADEPISYQASMRTWWWRSRVLQCNLDAKRLLARDLNVEIHHPFADPDVLLAYGADRGRLGPPGRVWAIRELFGDLLPQAVIERESKSTFNGAFWTGAALPFVERWGGEGVDTDLVDIRRLRDEWMRPEPSPHSFALLQQAFLADCSGRRPRGTEVAGQAVTTAAAPILRRRPSAPPRR